MPDLKPLDHYPSLGTPWWRFPPVLGTLVALAIGSAGGLAYEYSPYPTWGEMRTASGTPPRIDWCGRRYYPYPRAQSADSLPITRPLVRVETTPAGDAVLAALFSEREKANSHTSVCAMALYVRVGPDSFLHYMLSGGP